MSACVCDVLPELATSARVLTPSDHGTPLTFLDGSWRQVGRMVRKRRELQALTPVSLPVAGESRYPLREGGRFDELSTLEATAIAMGIVESEEHERALRVLLDAFVERTLVLRGQAGVGQATGSEGSEKIHSCSGPSSGGGEGAEGPT